MGGARMKRSELIFERPPELAARQPAASRGVERDAGRLLVSGPSGHRHACFRDLAEFLNPGDLLVVNRSATLPASLTAEGQSGPFTLNLSTNYGAGLWLAEPRRSLAEPGPLPDIAPGATVRAGGLEARWIAPYPGLPRLWFVQFSGDVRRAMRQAGQPIRYGYLDRAYGLNHYQTIFASVPGSAEMPSAGYPFTRKLVARLRQKGIQMAGIILHTGVSSLEVEAEDIDDHPLYPEPFQVTAATAAAVNAARAEKRRVIAVGTTVVRALESAWDGRRVRACSGFSRLYIRPGHSPQAVDGLITGLHDPVTSHIAMLYAIGGKKLIREGYAEAVKAHYHWHEFGDSHLILVAGNRKAH